MRTATRFIAGIAAALLAASGNGPLAPAAAAAVVDAAVAVTQIREGTNATAELALDGTSLSLRVSAHPGKESCAPLWPWAMIGIQSAALTQTALDRWELSGRILAPHKTYTIAINWWNAACTADSFSWTITTPLDPPRQVAYVDAGPTSATVSWAPPLLHADQVTGYELSAHGLTGSPIQIPPATYDASARLGTLTGLMPSTTYHVQIRARSNHGPGSPATVTVSTAIALPDAAVVDVTAAGTTGTVTMTSALASGFDVTLSSPADTRSLPASRSPLHLTDLVPNTTYKLAVTARNASGPAVATTRQIRTGPRSPEGLRTSPTATTIGVSWQPVPGATIYRVKAGAMERVVTGTSALITGLAARTTFQVTVTPYGGSVAGDQVRVTARTTLSPATKARATTTSATTATLAWTPVKGAAIYLIGLPGAVHTWSTPTPKITLTGLTPGRAYTGTITATAPGEAPSQTPVTFATAPPSAAVLKITRHTATSLTVRLPPAASGTQRIVRIAGKGGRTVTATGRTVTIAGLRANTRYVVRARIRTGARMSGWSPAYIATTAKKARPRLAVARKGSRATVRVAPTPLPARVRVQTRVHKTWRTVKTAWTRPGQPIRVKVRFTSRIRVIVAPTAETSKLTWRL